MNAYRFHGVMLDIKIPAQDCELNVLLALNRVTVGSMCIPMG